MDNESEPNVTCENCGRDIPESKSFLHEAYCVRNVIRCPKCNEPVDKNEMTQHENENHKSGSCKYCRKDLEKRLLEEHQESCPQKPKMCQYCNCEVSTHEYAQHIYTCGSRTKKCPFCNKNILVRDYDDHEPVCQIKYENYGENFPAMQEEKKDTTSNPYSGISSKYIANSNPTTNPYESLNQPTMSKSREQGTSKHESQSSSHHRKSNATEDTKPSSRSDPRNNNDILNRITSKNQESTSNNYPKTREEKPSVPTTAYPTSSKYSADPRTTNAPEPYKSSYQREDLTAGQKPYSNPVNYKPESYGVSGGYNRPGVPSYSAATSDVGRTGNPTTSQTSSKPKTYLDNLVTRGQPETSSKRIESSKTAISTDPRIGASGRPKVAETKPEYGYSAPENTQNRPKETQYNAKYDPFGKGLSNVNKYSKPEDLKTNATSQNRVSGSDRNYARADSNKATSGVSYPDKYKAEARPEDKKRLLSDFTNSDSTNTYGGASRSNQPQYPSYTTGQTSSNLNKKPEPTRYEATSKVASKLTDFSNKPSQESRAQDPRLVAPKESTAGKYGTSQSRTDKATDYTRTQDRSSTNSSQQRKEQAVPSYNPQEYIGGYEDDYGLGQDAELQKAIQESLAGGSKKKGPEKPSSRNFKDDAVVNQSMDDPELQRAIQESLKGHY